MSDVVLYDRGRESGGRSPSHTRTALERNVQQLHILAGTRHSTITSSGTNSNRSSTTSLLSLPFDVLLQIVQSLDVEDVMRLVSTCIALRDLDKSRPVWLNLATRMLDRCEPLPVDGFHRLHTLSTASLANTVKRGHTLQSSWKSTTRPNLPVKSYKSFSAPGNEDIVWLSAVTSKYTLLCTKNGKVLCWDTIARACVAEWYSGDDWEIWKCRVEFDERVVYLAMARRVLSGSGTDCQLMSLNFPAELPDSELTVNQPTHGITQPQPWFTKLASFNLPGHVISVFLLDPPKRLLTAYIWLEESNTLGLYVLVDWGVPLYVFVDTGIIYDHRKEWSCIGYDPTNIVIHAEDKDTAEQYFYPIHSLREYASTPPPSCSRNNVSPTRHMPPTSTTSLPVLGDPTFSQYWSYSAHFVRQWWPTLPYTDRIRRRSCTIILLARQLPDYNQAADTPPYPDGTHAFTIAQHYFSIPLCEDQLRWWYVKRPFEIVCFPHVTTPAGGIAPAFDVEGMEGGIGAGAGAGAGDGAGIDAGGANANVNANNAVANFNDNDDGDNDDAGDDDDDDDDADDPLLDLPPNTHIVPLIAVDFGCVVWVEYTHIGGEDKRLRFVSFPTVDDDRDDPTTTNNTNNNNNTTNGNTTHSPLDSYVRTLETPPEINLSQVCHIGIDQSQGAVILGLMNGKIFIIRYE